MQGWQYFPCITDRPKWPVLLTTPMYATPQSTLYRATVHLAGNKRICSGFVKIISITEQFSSFQDYLTARSILEQWCYRSIRHPNQCHLLIHSIWQGSLAIVRNGSYMLDHATAGIIIVGTKNARVEYCVIWIFWDSRGKSYTGLWWSLSNPTCVWYILPSLCWRALLWSPCGST